MTVPQSVDREVVDEPVLAGLDVDFDFGERRHPRLRVAFAAEVVARDADQPLPGEPFDRRLRHVVDVVRHLVTVELPPCLIAASAACANVSGPTRPLATV